MLADERVDVVHLTTPNHLHHPQVKAVLAAGKHVVCEKPLAMTSAESAELLRLAESSGVVHCTNYNLRFYPLSHEARARVASGRDRPCLERARHVRPGLAAPADRLELAARPRARRLAARRRRHRHALVRPDGLDHRPPRRRRLRRPLHRARGAARSDRPSRDLRGRRRRRAGRSPDVDRGHRPRAAALRGRHPGAGDDLAGERRAEEPPHLGARRLRGRAGLEHGAARGALARSQGHPERDPPAGPRAHVRPAARGLSRPATPRGSPTRSSSSTARCTAPSRPAGCPRSPTSRRSRTGTKRS